MKFTFAKTIAAAALTAGLFGQAYAATAEPWSVDETSVITAAQLAAMTILNPDYDGTFDVNRLTFSYDSTITQGAFSGNPLTANFSETGTFTGTQYFTGFVPGGTAGTQVVSAMGAGVYNIVGSFTFDGTATIVSAQQLEVNVDTGTVGIWIDLKDGDSIQDIYIGSASNVLFGGAILSRPNEGTAANGSFEVVYDNFALTDPAGMDYWPSPDPFHLILDVTAQLIALEGIFDLDGTEVTTNGDGSAYFKAVPEPGTLALLGLAMLGLGGSRLRSNKKVI